jgi:hypothetical protein
MKTNEILTKDLQNQIDENKKNINNMKNIKYIQGFKVTPEYDCYAELYAVFSGWAYGGKNKPVSINAKSGNTTLIATANSGVMGHDTVPDAGMCMAVYELKKGVSYEFNISGIEGGTIANNMIMKLIPII